jgi:2-hydroxychromene-2-carboxylate isomerase
VYARFFERALEIDRAEDVAATIERLGGSAAEYLAFLEGEGRAAFEACLDEAAADHIFGVPIFVFRGEPFWGQDRMALLEERLTEAGLRLESTPG